VNAKRKSGRHRLIKHPPGFGVELLVDDSAAVLAASRAHGFAVVHSLLATRRGR
jgi:hypothetical protein